MNNGNGDGPLSLVKISAWLALSAVALHGVRFVRTKSAASRCRRRVSRCRQRSQEPDNGVSDAANEDGNDIDVAAPLSSGNPPFNFRLFQCNFTVPMVLAYSCDWLSGPYTYVRLEGFGLSKSTISRLYLCGYISSAFAALYVGSLADRYGRRNMCILFCLTEMVNCAMFSYNWIPSLIAVRLLGGMKSCIMWTCFEAWMVQQHRLSRFPDEYLTLTFSTVSLCNALSGVSCGFIASFLANRWGTIAVVWAPFFTAIVALLWILILWNADRPLAAASGDDGLHSEITGDVGATTTETLLSGENEAVVGIVGEEAASIIITAEEHAKNAQCLSAAFKFMRKDYRIALVGVAQAAFGSSLMLFEVNWTPALPRNIDHGLVFALFMLAMTAGSALLPLLSDVGADATLVLFLLLCGAIVSFFVVSTTSACLSRLLAFLLLEAVAGGTYPSLSVLQSRYLPEKLRATIISLYRFPLEGIVGITLALGPNRSVVSIYQQCLITCAVGALAALVLFARRNIPRRPLSFVGPAAKTAAALPVESTTLYS